jgi:hypothetical protein
LPIDEEPYNPEENHLNPMHRARPSNILCLKTNIKGGSNSMNLVLGTMLVLIISEEVFPCGIDQNASKTTLDSYYHENYTPSMIQIIILLVQKVNSTTTRDMTLEIVLDFAEK